MVVSTYLKNMVVKLDQFPRYIWMKKKSLKPPPSLLITGFFRPHLAPWPSNQQTSSTLAGSDNTTGGVGTTSTWRFGKLSRGGSRVNLAPTWRIVPGWSKWLITIVIVGTSPEDRVVRPLPNGRTSWLINGGYEALTNWDDPPSTSSTYPRPLRTKDWIRPS